MASSWMRTLKSKVPDPAFGAYLFDASAESLLERSTDSAAQRWFGEYLRHNTLHISAITVMERMRGYALALERAVPAERANISSNRDTYLVPTCINQRICALGPSGEPRPWSIQMVLPSGCTL